jgi:hypothetical protein
MQANLYDSIKSALARNYTLDRIFLMYRADQYRSLRAYIALAKFYRDRNMKESFLKTALLGSLTAFTRMYAFVVERDVGYEYKGVKDFFVRASRFRDMTVWSINQDVWDCLYYLYEATDALSFHTFSNELLPILAQLSPDLSVQERAARTMEKQANSR